MADRRSAGCSDLLGDADDAIRQLYSDHAGARSRPVEVPASSAQDMGGDDSGLVQPLDRQLVSDALEHLSPAHRTVLVETFYGGGSTAVVARKLGIPNGTARSRLHYALDAMRRNLQEHDVGACR